MNRQRVALGDDPGDLRGLSVVVLDLADDVREELARRGRHSWLSVRSKVYFMLCAVTTPLAGGENAKSFRIWNVYVSPSSEIVGIAAAISGRRRVALGRLRVWVIDELRAGRVFELPGRGQVGERWIRLPRRTGRADPGRLGGAPSARLRPRLQRTQARRGKGTGAG